LRWVVGHPGPLINAELPPRNGGFSALIMNGPLGARCACPGGGTARVINADLLPLPGS
jgi:hypothetical protein